jgi:hypothetical protein
VDGWTPLIDELVQLYGVVGASVFGRIWRYCQMKDHVCSVPLSRIAEDLKMDKSTIMRYAVRLCEDGYLKDKTPDAGNRPHVYADTGKASIGVTVKAKSGTPNKQESDLKSVVLNNEIVAQNNVALNNVAQNNEIVAQSNASVAQNNAHIRNIRNNKESNKRESFPAPVLTSSNLKAESQAIEIYQTLSGHSLDNFQQELIAGQVTDLGVWQKVLEKLKANQILTHRVGTALEMYRERIEVKAKQNSGRGIDAPYS